MDRSSHGFPVVTALGCSSAAQRQNPPTAAPPSAVQSTGDSQTAQGDLVLLHTRSQNKPGPDVALTDIFRVTDGKIVERWTASQPVPPQSANPNTMF